MVPLDACAGRVDVGRKAETLARLRAAGLRTPDGFVLLPDEEVDGEALAQALSRLGGERFAVRSSSVLEDGAGGSAAGLFASVVGVAASDVAAAIARVRSSASSPALAAYVAARGLAGEARVAVLVQPLVDAPTFAVAHSAGDAFAVEERDAGEPEWGDVRAARIARDDGGALATGLRALETIVGGPVDAELARDGERITWLQARPLAPAMARPPLAWRLDEPGRWRRDAEHNPDPLSPAQASLVAFVDGLGVGARQRVVDGYLYVESGAPPRGLTPIALPELRRAFERDLVPDCHAVLARARADGSLDAARAAFAHVYSRYVGEVAPSLAVAKQQLDHFLRVELGEPLSQHGALLAGLGGRTLARDQALWELGGGTRALADVLAEFGDHAPAWDVAVTTDGERPDRVLALAAELARGPSPAERHRLALQSAKEAETRVTARLPERARQGFTSLLRLVRDVLPLAEDDDLLFLGAQATVRAALLRAGQLSADDGPRPALRVQPPDAFVDGRPEWHLPRARRVLRGHGTSGQARGRAVVVRALADAPSRLPPCAVLIVPAIIPSLTPLLPQAVALVTDHGGALSHGATLAREYGVPAVLGTGSATTIADGADLYVDADAGRVLMLDEV